MWHFSTKYLVLFHFYSVMIDGEKHYLTLMFAETHLSSFKSKNIGTNKSFWYMFLSHMFPQCYLSNIYI